MDTILVECDESTELKKISDELFSFIPGIERASPVPVVKADGLTEADFYKNWVSNNKPCLIKGAVRHWPAVKKWRNKEYWHAACDNFEVKVFPHQNYNDEKKRKGEAMPFYDAIDRLFEKKDPILSIPSEPISEDRRFFRVLKDIKDFPFLSPDKMPRMYDHRRFFIYRKASTAWHYHNIDETLMCQVNGGKRVVLLSPRIPHAKYVAKYLQDEMYLDNIVLDPSLELKSMSVNVEEGDALYIPPYWHHAVAPIDAEVGFTLAYCWRSPWHIMGNFSNYFVRDLYKKAIWPLNKFTPFLPFLGFYAGASYYLRSGTKRLLGRKEVF
jgi:hypothetical protein